MESAERTKLTQAIRTFTDEDESGAQRLLELVYEELRTLARQYLPDGRAATLQPTALVHEAYLKLGERAADRFHNPAHFKALCALAMRSALADHARRRHAAKRGGDWERITLSDLDTPVTGRQLDALALEEALEALAELNERQARIVEYRFFAGMTVDESARVLGISRSTVEDDWRMARAWLTVRLQAS